MRSINRRHCSCGAVVHRRGTFQQHSCFHWCGSAQWAVPSPLPIFLLLSVFFCSDVSVALIPPTPACSTQRIVHTPVQIINAVWAWQTGLKHKKRNPGSLPPYVPYSNPHPPSSLLPPSHPRVFLNLGVPLSSELQALITENELRSCASGVCANASVFVIEGRDF